jgi:hypothetical protein
MTENNDNNEIVVVEGNDQPAAPSSTDMMITPEDLQKRVDIEKANRKILMEFAASQMIEGVDYHIIKGKKSLGKPGAEKICSLFHVTIGEPKFDQQAFDNLPQSVRDAGAIVLRVSLYRNGAYIGSGVGARSLTQDSNDLNKAMKMAKKSAIVDATISAFGLSDLFTQDIEDMDKSKIDNNSTGTGTRDYSSTPRQSSGGAPSPAQKKFLGVLYMKKEGMSYSQALSKANQITQSFEASKEINRLKNLPDGGVQEEQPPQEPQIESRDVDTLPF